MRLSVSVGLSKKFSSHSVESFYDQTRSFLHDMHSEERNYYFNKLLGTITCEECDIGVQFQQFIEILGSR